MGPADVSGVEEARERPPEPTPLIEHIIDIVYDRPPPTASRLALLRFLERVQVRDLERTRRWIAQEERREAAERRRGARVRREELGRAEWLVERGLGGQAAVYVHAGGCWNSGKRSHAVSREEARRALTEGVPACPQCRPDTELGLLD